MRKKCLSTPQTWAFPGTEHADHTVPNGWDVAGSAGPKTALIPTAIARFFVERSAGWTNRGGTTNGGGSRAAKVSSSLRATNETPVALCSLTEIVDQPIEWVVEGVIPGGEWTLITGEAGVGKSGFLAGLIANVTRGRPGPRVALRPEDSGHSQVQISSKWESDLDTDFDVDSEGDSDLDVAPDTICARNG